MTCNVIGKKQSSELANTWTAKQSVSFFLKISKAWLKSPTRAKRASLSSPVGRVRRIFSVSPVSLSIFRIVLDRLFEYQRVPEYAKIRTVLQSKYFTSLFSSEEVLRKYILMQEGMQYGIIRVLHTRFFSRMAFREFPPFLMQSSSSGSSFMSPW